MRFTEAEKAEVWDRWQGGDAMRTGWWDSASQGVTRLCAATSVMAITAWETVIIGFRFYRTGHRSI